MSEVNPRDTDEQHAITSKNDLDNCYIAIQEGDFDKAYTLFISGIDKNDNTLGGLIFETIINGLTVFGYIKTLQIKSYGIPQKSIDLVKAIPKSEVIDIFQVIYNIAHNKERYLNMTLIDCFKQEKDKKQKEK